jgi:hypothetical protein
MLTIPKLIEPLQIALAMLSPPYASWALGLEPGRCRKSKESLPVFSTPAALYPQAYQHNLLINNDLRRWIICR